MGNNKKKKIDAYDFMKVDDTSHKQFINEWYSHPETKRRLRNAFTTPSDKSLNSLYSLGESYAQITGKNPFNPELNSQVDSLINTSLNKINNAEGYYEFPDQITKKYSGVNENTLGFTLKNNPENYIINNKNRDINRSVPLHELTHISGLDVFNDSNFKNSEDLLLKHSKNLTDYKKYLINEPEVYPRVMEIRFNNKIKPGQILKKGDIDTNHRSFQELMKIYNNENEVYDILNTMANNTEASDNLVQSMNGGKINNMRKKKYFVGGAVTTGASALGASDSVAQGLGDITDIGVGVGRLAAGDVSAAPGLISKGIGVMGKGINNSIGLMTNKNASTGDKALGAIGMLGAANPLFSMVTGSRIDKLNQMAADDDQMNNIIKNNRMANGGKVKNDFQEYRNPFQTLQGITPRIPVNNPVELQRPPDRYTNTPMQGIPQGQLPNQGAPQMLDKLTGIPSYATFAPEQLYRNLSTNQYAGVPTTLPKKGERVNIEELSTARNEKLRNKNLMDYITKSLMTSQTIHGDSKGNIEDTWRNYVQSPQGMERLEQATNPSMMNFADGGQLTQFNGGFTHNDQNLQNSFEGIPQGMSPTGEVNTVEKGETRWQDFIFSDKLKLDKNTAARLGFKKTDVGKTFADLSKKYSKESEDRPNDPITAKTLNIHMENLMAANENAKQINEIGEIYKMAKGGKLNINKYDGGSVLDLLGDVAAPQVIQEKSQLTQPINNPYAEQGMRAAGFYGGVGNIQFENPGTLSGKLGYLDGVDPENKDYGLFRNLTPQQYESSYMPWVNETYGTTDNVKNQQDLLNNFDPNSELWQSYSPEEQERRYRLLGELKGKGYDTTDPNKVMGLVTDKKVGPATSLMNYSPYQQMTVEDFELPDETFEFEDTGIPEDSKVPPPPIKPPTNPPTNPPNLWPELGLAGNLGAMAMLDPTYMSPSTMSTGYLRPQMIDEQTMRGGIDAANRANIGALANVTGGSGAAQRAGLLGQGVNYMGATGNAFTQVKQANNDATFNADLTNLNTQNATASQNLNWINRFAEQKANTANQYNILKADTFASAVGDYSVAGADRRMSNDASRFWGKATGYDPKTAQYLLAMQNANKPAEETKVSAYGGIIKTRKRKLK